MRKHPCETALHHRLQSISKLQHLVPSPWACPPTPRPWDLPATPATEDPAGVMTLGSGWHCHDNNVTCCDMSFGRTQDTVNHSEREQCRFVQLQHNCPHLPPPPVNIASSRGLWFSSLALSAAPCISIQRASLQTLLE